MPPPAYTTCDVCELYPVAHGCSSCSRVLCSYKGCFKQYERYNDAPITVCNKCFDAISRKLQKINYVADPLYHKYNTNDTYDQINQMVELMVTISNK